MKRIVVFGRTGAGKSSLGNRIFGSGSFKEGHTLSSETNESIEKIFNWPLDASLQVSFIDTPGFADNRPNTSNQKILNNIFKLIKDLKGGFNVGIFCIAAKSRIDSHDLDEIKLLQIILGSGVFKHLWIAITQMNALNEQVKTEYYEKIPRELSEILKAADIPLSSDRILFADFSEFENKFLNPLDQLVHDYPSYQPETTLQLVQDEQTFWDSPTMQTILRRYGEMFTESKDQLTKTIEQMKKHGSTNSALQKQIQKKEEDLKQLQEKIEEINRLQIEALDEWVWKVNESFRLSQGKKFAEHTGENKFRMITAKKSLDSEDSKWQITIDKKCSFLSNLAYYLTPGCPMFGIQDHEGNIYSVSYQGSALANMKNTESFRNAKIQNNAEFICEVERDTGRFKISVGDLVIAINRDPLKPNSKFYPFVFLWKGNTALIKPLV